VSAPAISRYQIDRWFVYYRFPPCLETKYFLRRYEVETPEFDTFKKIEDLEEHFKGTPAQKDALILAVAGLETAFISASMQSPAYARQYKDQLLASLKQVGLSNKWFDAIQSDLTAMCDHLNLVLSQNTDTK
jgi:hypothetical protein